MSRRTGFTLVELLVSLSIVILLAGIISPVLARARRDGRKTVSISNLRQCGIALLLYSQDYDGANVMPTYDAATVWLKGEPTCDPNDYWRRGCHPDWGAPLIGSYGYVRGVNRYSSDDGWNDYLTWMDGPNKSQASLLISIFYADNSIAPFHGEQPEIGPECGVNFVNCLMPNHVVRFRLDGSTATTSWSSWHIPNNMLFNWEGLFFYAE